MINSKLFVKRVFTTLFIFLITATISEASFILHNEGILTDKTSEKIESIGKELKDKSGIDVYVSVRRNLGGQHIAEYSKDLASKLNGSFAILIFAEMERKVEIISSSDISNNFNKNKVLNDYTIPLIATMDKNSENSRYNAGLLNGYSELAEQLAEFKKIKLVNAIGDESSSVIQFIRVIVYAILLGFAVIYFYNMLFRRNK